MTISYAGDFIQLLARWKGSVWKAVWKEALVWLFLYYSIRLGCILFLNEEQMDVMKKLVRLFDSFTAKIPLQFLLGFYVGQVVTRWWAQVQAVPWPDDCMVWTNTFFYKNDRSTRIKRRLIARYLILCETLVLRNVSTRIRKRFHNVRSLIQAGLMTDEEYELYEKVSVENNRWQLPLQWIINGIVVPAVERGDIPAAGAGTIISKVNEFRSALRLIYIYDWICIPLVYTQTCSVVVYGYFAFCLIGHQFFGQEADLYVPFLTILQFIFFVGWFKVAQDLMRPFGEDDDDVELNVVLDRHAAVAMNFADELCTLIPTFGWDHHDHSSPSSQSMNGDDSGHHDHHDSHDQDDISYIDGAPKAPHETIIIDDHDHHEDDDDHHMTNPLFYLPYSRAAIKSAKHDHRPKMHALVKLKSPDEEELIVATTWIRTYEQTTRIEMPNGNATTDGEDKDKKKKKKEPKKVVKFTNPF